MTASQVDIASESHPRHAGVDDDGLTVVAFDTEEELRTLLGAIGITVDTDRLLRSGEGRALSCASCEKTVPVEQVGHVLPGSAYVYCKDPVCVLDYLERFA